MDAKNPRVFPWHPDEISPKNPALLRNFVGGAWTTTRTTQEIPDPLTGKTIIIMPDTSEEELEPFIEALRQCPTYGLHNPLLHVERYDLYGRIGRDAAAVLRSTSGRNYFAKLINRVMPKGLEQCYGEVDVVATFLENFAGDQVRFLARGTTTPGTKLGQQATDYRWPYGPVAIITPFNFPLEIMTLQLMGALYMGNKPILKQSSYTSIVAEAFVRLLLHCGLPKDDVLLIHCRGSVMEKLVTNPVVRLIQFTGGSDVAQRLLRLTGGRCKIEDAGFDWKLLGPNVIPNMIDAVASQCDRDAYAASGQKCSAQSILFAHDRWVKAGLLKKVNVLAAKRNLSDLSIGPVLTWSNENLAQHVARLLAIPGAELLFGGKPLSCTHTIPARYGSFEPTAVFVPLAQIIPHFAVVTTEVFGPVQVVTTWSSAEDLEMILAQFEMLENRLTAGVVDNDPEFLTHVLARSTNGVTYAGIRARTTGAPQWHFFGPTGHPAGAGIGTPEAIRDVWSQNRTIIMDTGA